MDEIACAANWTPGQPPCTSRDAHLTTCGDAQCRGCQPRPAVHGYLCRGHYERWESTFAALDRLRGLLLTIGNGRAVQATSSASTTAGPRVPLSALRLDLDALDRAPRGDVETADGAVAELLWSRQVWAAHRRHPTEPKRERLHRVRCASCNQVAVVTDPPTIAGGDTILRCVACGWQSQDQDHAEAAAYTEALVRDPYRPKRRLRQEPAGLERLIGVAKLAAALSVFQDERR